MPNFAFYGGCKKVTMKSYFSFCTWIWCLHLIRLHLTKWVGIIAIKTERTQILFLSDVLINAASLDLKVPVLGRRKQQIYVRIVVAAIFDL